MQPTGGNGDSGGNGGNTGIGDDDDDDAPVEILSVSAEVHTISQATITVELSGEADVAAACVAVDDPEEVHLAEGTASPTVALRFAGLLMSTDYDCSVATTTVDGDPFSISLRTLDPPAGASVASADAYFDPTAEMTSTYTIMNVKPECRADNGANYIAVLDPDGNNRWRYELPYGMNIGVRVTLDGYNRILWGGGDTTDGVPQVVDVLDGVQWTLAFPGSEDVDFHHDTSRLADGRILSVAHHDDPGWLATELRLTNDAGDVEWLWDIQEAIADGDLPAVGPDSDDPHHVNAADVVDTDEGLVAYLSLCFSEQIMAVDVSSGDVLWRFGPYASFTLVDAAGTPVEDQLDFPQCQHGIRFDGTNLLVYDNGIGRGYTRAVEWKLDLDNRTAEKTWEWLDDGWYELYHGGLDWLTPDHSRVLVSQTAQNCEPDERHPQIVELDRSQGDLVVHRLTMREVTDWFYRAHRVDGCDLFANAKYCPDVAARVEALRATLEL